MGSMGSLDVVNWFLGFLWYLVLISLVVLPLLWKLSPTFRYFAKMTTFYICAFLAAVFCFPIVIWWPFDPTNYK